jgi:hypothetical protein
MWKSLAIVVVALYVCVAPGCVVVSGETIQGSGNVIEESRDVAPFTGVQLAGSGEVFYTAGPPAPVRILADDNLLPYVKTEVRKNVLHLYLDTPNNTSVNITTPIQYFVTAPTLDRAAVSGSGDFTCDRIDGEALELEIIGSGNFRVDAVAVSKLSLQVSGTGNIALPQVTADTLEGVIAGSGDVSLTGEVPNQSYQVAGAGNVNAEALAGRDVAIDIAGSGDARIHATATLDVSIAGSGSVHYHGSPRITSDIQGSGTLTPANNKGSSHQR